MATTVLAVLRSSRKSSRRLRVAIRQMNHHAYNASNQHQATLADADEARHRQKCQADRQGTFNQVNSLRPESQPGRQQTSSARLEAAGAQFTKDSYRTNDSLAFQQRDMAIYNQSHNCGTSLMYRWSAGLCAIVANGAGV